MKKCFIFILLIFISNSLSAQGLVDSALHYRKANMSYQDAIEAKIAQMRIDDPGDTTEGGEIDEFVRRTNWLKYYYATTVPLDSDAFASAASVIMSYMTQPDNYCSGFSEANWHCIGPFNNSYGTTENQGRVNCVWVSPSDTNFILIGT